jgi:hypothetical protein
MEVYKLQVESHMHLSSQYERSPNPGIEVRRSSRIPLIIQILIAGIHPETGVLFEAAGKTLIVNKHGALISTIPGLRSEMRLCITVVTSGKSGGARVVWDSPQSEGRYGIELDNPGNFWEIFAPPADWET